MSIYRVITRIIPLNSSESTFEPASFDALTDGSVGEVKVLNLTEPQTGMKYRIERIEYVQNVGPGETIESVNTAYAEKLKNIPGFVQLKANEAPLNPYDKSFQLTLPKVLFSKASGESSSAKPPSQSKSSDSFKISVVKNFNFNKPNSPYKKRTGATSAVSSYEHDDFQNDVRSPKGFKTKYPSYLSKKLKNSVWRNKNRTSPTKHSVKSPKQFKAHRKLFLGDCHVNNSSTPGPLNYDCPASSYVQANKDIDTRRALDVRITEQLGGKKNSQLNDSLEDDSTKRNNSRASFRDEEKTDTSVDQFDDLEYGELVINVPEAADSCSREDDLPGTKNNSPGSLIPATFDKPTVNGSLNNSAIDDDCLTSDSYVTSKQNDPEGSNICNKYLVLEEHPLYDLLMSLKKYFVNGECLICGFIPADIEFNASEHMESHISSNSFISCFKCSCCDEKFGSPKNLYLHALAREKSYRYMCNICLLKFKRKHYLMRHTAKSH